MRAHTHDTYSRPASRIERAPSRNQLGTSGGGDVARRQQLRTALVRKLLSKYHPGIANSKTEATINKEVDRLMSMVKVTEKDLHAVEALVRQQSNEEIAWITTNPFKRVTAYKSGAQDEWAMVNELMVKAGFDAEAKKQQVPLHNLPLPLCAGAYAQSFLGAKTERKYASISPSYQVSCRTDIKCDPSLRLPPPHIHYPTPSGAASTKGKFQKAARRANNGA